MMRANAMACRKRKRSRPERARLDLRHHPRQPLARRTPHLAATAPAHRRRARPRFDGLHGEEREREGAPRVAGRARRLLLEDFEVPVLGGGCDVRGVRPKAHARERVRVRLGQRQALVPRLAHVHVQARVPGHGKVGATVVEVRVEGCASKGLEGRSVGALFCHLAQVPHLGAVLAARGKVVAVLREAKARHRPAVPTKRERSLLRLDVPHGHGAVGPPRPKEQPVRVER
mmetsp:Transcript_28628/g.70868  ORF Transcript_28628/g.70868 Transcript_28628/m.70868 type:complete len:230 (+) Transcript_28628:85-774(+)